MLLERRDGDYTRQSKIELNHKEMTVSFFFEKLIILSFCNVINFLVEWKNQIFGKDEKKLEIYEARETIHNVTSHIEHQYISRFVLYY